MFLFSPLEFLTGPVLTPVSDFSRPASNGVNGDFGMRIVQLRGDSVKQQKHPVPIELGLTPNRCGILILTASHTDKNRAIHQQAVLSRQSQHLHRCRGQRPDQVWYKAIVRRTLQSCKNQQSIMAHPAKSRLTVHSYRRPSTLHPADQSCR